jgi:hypothetical protein
MKNKSKLQKIRPVKTGEKTYPKEWLYLNDQVVTPRNVADVFSDEGHLKAQLWEDAGVVEIELPGEAKSLDMEITATDFGDDFSNEYLAKNQIQSAFLVTIVPEDYEAAKEVMKKITAAIGGYFCGDTPDFTPIVK